MQLILHNMMEDYVIMTLDEVMGMLDGCKCERCRLDMASYALNRLKPRYITTTQGEMMSRLCEFDSQFKTSIIKELTLARSIINEHPNHTPVS